MASIHILAVGKIVRDGIEMDTYSASISMPPWVDPNEPVDGELQRLIDEAADTEDYEWDIEQRNIWRKGGW